MHITLIFPHQLNRSVWSRRKVAQVILVEEWLFFRQYRFHRSRLVFMRASILALADDLRKRDVKVDYISSADPLSDIRNLIPELKTRGIHSLQVEDPCDYLLERRLRRSAETAGLNLEWESSSLFINETESLDAWFAQRVQYRQTDFYIQQRKKRNILILPDRSPVEGKWTFDTENRRRYPKGKAVPGVPIVARTQWHREAEESVLREFPDNPGEAGGAWRYPVTPEAANEWLMDFLNHRFREFGDYEDALVTGEPLLHHSLLAPLLNSGLLEPLQVVNQAVDFAAENHIPFNSLEGFVRQILGWREFVHGIYRKEGVRQRKGNFWKCSRPMPKSFYDASTGLVPADDAIRKVLQTGYNHHIERLMVLSNLMLLCEIRPDDVYRWFMEMYIDSLDVFMVPNVYGMGQFADGGLMCSKPYISGSNYLLKMSNYSKGPWTETWDGLFWRFMDRHRSFFTSNPRLGMLVRSFDAMAAERRKRLLDSADSFLEQLT